MQAITRDFKPGDRVIYVPMHAMNDIDHPDCEKGFVTSVSARSVFCRYFAKTGGKREAYTLRTTANSEATNPGDLIKHKYCPKELIEAMRKTYKISYYIFENEKAIEMRYISKDRDLMTMKEFIKCCNNGLFVDYDGFGYYATSLGMTNIIIKPSDVHTDKLLDYSHIVWFNK